MTWYKWKFWRFGIAPAGGGGCTIYDGANRKWISILGTRIYFRVS